MKLTGDALAPAAHVTFGELYLLFPNKLNLKLKSHTQVEFVDRESAKWNEKLNGSHWRLDEGRYDGIKDGVMNTKGDAIVPAAYVTFSELFMSCSLWEVWVQCQMYNVCTQECFVLYALKV